jgi:hypothetical protein
MLSSIKLYYVPFIAAGNAPSSSDAQRSGQMFIIALATLILFCTIIVLSACRLSYSEQD